MPTCALCMQNQPLRNSHIIPAFVFRWMRETSATGFFRSGENPSIRVQDGLKLPLLCESCEQRFSRLERQFANEIFYPILKDKVPEVAYSRWFLKYCVSISWRVLTYAQSRNLIGLFNIEQQRETERALARWSAFLLDKEPHPGRFEQRLVLLGGVAKAHPNAELQPNTNRYFLRSIDVDLASSDRSAFTYAKVGPFALFGMVESSQRWLGTKINANAGTVGPKGYVIPPVLFAYLMERAQFMSQTYRTIPPAQQAQLESAILKRPKRFLESETFKAMKQDVRMFGSAALWNHANLSGNG